MKKYIKYIVYFLIFAILTTFVVFEPTLAKYVKTSKEDVLYSPGAFYFNSDLLDDSSSPKTYYLQPGVDDISFYVRNYEDELRISEVGFNLEVSITTLQGASVSNANGVIANQRFENSNIEKVDQKVEINDLYAGTYLVTAKSYSRYIKSLSAIFVISDEDNSITYNVSDSADSPVLQLTVLTSDYSGNVTISYPAGVVPDNTCSYFTNANSNYASGNITVEFNSNSEYTFQFFKQNLSTVYTNSNFQVSASN